MLWVGKNISVDNKGMYVSGRFQHWRWCLWLYASLVPRPPPFLPSVCVFTMFTIHGSGKAVKNGESLGSFIAWMTSGKVDVREDQARWMYEGIRQGGCTREGPNCKNNALAQAVYSSSGLQMLAWSILLVFTSNKVTLELNLYILECQPLPSPPTCIHSHDEWARAFPVFRCFSGSMSYNNGNWRTKKWGHPGNEANFILYWTRKLILYLQHVMVS